MSHETFTRYHVYFKAILDSSEGGTYPVAAHVTWNLYQMICVYIVGKYGETYQMKCLYIKQIYGEIYIRLNITSNLYQISYILLRYAR